MLRHDWTWMGEQADPVTQRHTKVQHTGCCLHAEGTWVTPPRPLLLLLLLLVCSGMIPVLHGDGILEAAGPGGRYRDGQITPAILSGV